MSNTVLYALWGALYAICALLGFVTEPKNSLAILMTGLSLAHFVPPFVLNHRSARRKDRRTLQLVRNLSLAWLILTSVLIIGNFLTAFASQRLGNLMYALLTIAASPMIASGNWALAIFCWACVLFDARAKLKRM